MLLIFERGKQDISADSIFLMIIFNYHIDSLIACYMMLESVQDKCASNEMRRIKLISDEL